MSRSPKGSAVERLGATRSGEGLSGTKLRIAEAALATLRAAGFAGCSARAIAHEGGFNRALIFYHFGTVHNALLAAFDLVSEPRIHEYGPGLVAAGSVTELAFALVAAYFGVDLLSQLRRDHAPARALLESADRLAPLADTLLAGTVRGSS